MTKKRILIACLTLLLTATAAMAGDKWLHVRVQEHDLSDERVSVNIPLSMVRNILPLIHDDDFRGGVIRIDDDDWDGVDLPKLLNELRNAPDADYVTVQSRDENIRISKEGDFFRILAEEKDGSETVRVRFPLAIVDAMIGRDGEIDLIAALDALGEYTDGDLVTVESDDTSVRIWIDSRENGD